MWFVGLAAAVIIERPARTRFSADSEILVPGSPVHPTARKDATQQRREALTQLRVVTTGRRYAQHTGPSRFAWAGRPPCCGPVQVRRLDLPEARSHQVHSIPTHRPDRPRHRIRLSRPPMGPLPTTIPSRCRLHRRHVAGPVALFALPGDPPRRHPMTITSLIEEASPRPHRRALPRSLPTSEAWR